jgi:hypothetical protein
MLTYLARLSILGDVVKWSYMCGDGGGYYDLALTTDQPKPPLGRLTYNQTSGFKGVYSVQAGML